MRCSYFAALLGATMFFASPVVAQPTAKTYHFASLTGGSPFLTDNSNISMLLPALAEHGYKLGENLKYTPYGAEMEFERLPQMARDIAMNKIDVVVAFGYPSAAAMKGTGLARPGGNITGISDNAVMLSAKRLDLLKRAVPHIRNVAVLWNKKDLAMTLRYRASVEAAKDLGIIVQPLGVGEPDDFADAFTAMDFQPPDGILMVSDALTVLNRKRVYDYANAHRLPAIYESDPFVKDGGLMSYGADRKESLERTASLIDRILKGGKPADLPFEEPARYLFAINLKSAKAIGLEIPAQVVALADEVME
jgi:ABC-type uncharacterized transport system substrate-binding protein